MIFPAKLPRLGHGDFPACVMTPFGVSQTELQVVEQKPKEPEDGPRSQHLTARSDMRLLSP